MSERVGAEMLRLIEDLYPIGRSITGDGVRQTLRRIEKDLPLAVHEVPTGTPAFDWTVPREWNVRDAAIIDAQGRRVVDFRRSNLHVVSYSTPVRRRMTLAELRPHLHTIPEQPDRVPYRTSYYAEDWGFCLTQRQLDALPEGQYDVMIDATLEDGSLTYAECFLPGREAGQFILSCHVCHPSLANDNLSGIAVLTSVGAALLERNRRYSYRILFIPGTIGSLTWLSRNEDVLSDVRWGLTVAGVGDRGHLTYKRSRRDNAVIDRAVRVALRDTGQPFDEQAFSPYGYDERQFCSPGFDLPVGCLMRTPHNSYPEYHTSADDLSFVSADALAGTRAAVLSVIDLIEADATHLNLAPKGEPQLGRRGLYPSTGGRSARDEQMALLWMLNQSDGNHSMLDVAERSGYPHRLLRDAATKLTAAGLLKPVSDTEAAPSDTGVSAS